MIWVLLCVHLQVFNVEFCGILDHDDGIHKETEEKLSQESSSCHHHRCNYGLFYVTTDELNRPNSVWHVNAALDGVSFATLSPSAKIPSSSLPAQCFTKLNHQRNLSLQFSEPRHIYEQEDKSYHVDITRTKGGQYLCLNNQSKSSNEVQLISLLNDQNNKSNDIEIVLVKERSPNTNYFVNVGQTDKDVFIVANGKSEVGTDNNTNESSKVYQNDITSLPLIDGFGNRIQTTTTSDDGSKINVIFLIVDKYDFSSFLQNIYLPQYRPFT